MKRQKMMLVLVTIMSMVCTKVSAYDAEIDGICYDFSESGATVVSGIAYEGEVTIPETVSHNGKNYDVIAIGFNAFVNCRNLSTVNLGRNVTSIGEQAFWGCSGLTTINIPDNVTSIGYTAFANCTSLTAINIPNSVISIGYSAFSCSGLTAVDIPSSVESIGFSAFAGCSSLSTISIRNSVISIGLDAFAGCTSLTSVIFHCTEIGSWFQRIESIKDIVIGEEVTSITDAAFLGCSGITNITLPEGIKTIGGSAFKGTGLTTLTIPSTVTQIGASALVGKTIYCNNPTPPAATSQLADNARNITLYVPQGSIKAYSNADYWKDFFIMEMGTPDWTDGTVTVTVETPGQLRMSIVERDEDQITKLVVKGSINSEDLKYLHELTGKLADLESLDLSDVTLVYDDECYYTKFEPYEMALGAGLYSYYYLSETEYEEHWTGTPSIRGTNHYQAFHGNQLAGAFQDLPLKHVVMPKSVTKAARETFMGCSLLQEVEYPSGLKQIEDMAFSGCSRLRSFDVGQSNSIGVSAFYNCMTLEEIEGLGHVKYIGKEAFSGCTALKGNANGALVLEQVDSIPEQAFYGCSMLSNVRLSAKLYSLGQKAFSGCKSLTAIQLPESLKALPAETFADCSSLQQVIYSSSLRQVDAESFKNSAWMDNLPVENGIKYMGHIALAYDTNSGVAATSPATLTFREGTTTIADRFGNTIYYEHKNNVTAVEFPSTLRRIGDQAFYRSYYDTSLPIATLSLPEGLEEIGTYAFAGAASLTKLTLPENLKHIGDGAFSECQKLTQVVYHTKDAESQNLFENCKSLEKVTIGAKVQRLPNGIFSGCTNLLIVQSDDRTDDIPLEIGASAFNNCTTLTRLQFPANISAIGSNAFARCTSLSSFEIPQRVTTIESNTFYGCTGLTSVQLHKNVRIIGDEAFYGCEKISAITLPEGLDSIGRHAFSGCYGLTELTIPASVQHLGNDFLNDCYNLATLTSHITAPQPLSDIISMSNKVLSEVYGYWSNWGFYYDIHYGEMTLYVPSGSKSRYQSTNGWSRFTKIEEIKGPEYTLTYVVDGEVYKTVQVESGKAITPEPEPTKEGYTFSGWSEIPETMPANDVTVTGSFTINTYTLTYTVDGEVYKTLQVKYGDTIEAEEEPTKEGYTFSGWDIPETMPANDLTIAGSFTVNTYTLTYIVDGEIYKTVQVEYGSAITPEPEPTKESFTFSGWSEIPETMPANDVTVTGSFVVNTYTLTYLVDGEVYKTMQLEYGSVITPEPDPIKDGYIFSGWSEIPLTMPAYDVTVTGSYMMVDGIQGILAEDGDCQIFNLNGERVNALQKGTNIVRMSNGTVLKVYVK